MTRKDWEESVNEVDSNLQEVNVSPRSDYYDSDRPSFDPPVPVKSPRSPSAGCMDYSLFKSFGIDRDPHTISSPLFLIPSPSSFLSTHLHLNYSPSSSLLSSWCRSKASSTHLSPRGPTLHLDLFWSFCLRDVESKGEGLRRILRLRSPRTRVRRSETVKCRVTWWGVGPSRSARAVVRPQGRDLTTQRADSVPTSSRETKWPRGTRRGRRLVGANVKVGQKLTEHSRVYLDGHAEAVVPS